MLLPAAAIFAQSGGSFTLKGTINKPTGKEKAFLIHDNVIDSVALTNGAFEFKGNIDNPIKATLLVGHTGESFATLRRSRVNDVVSAYLEVGEIKLSPADSVKHATVIGGQINKDNEQLTSLLKPFRERMKKVDAEYEALPQDKKTPELEAEYEKRSEAIEAEQKVVQGQFIKAHPNSWVSLDALQSYGGYFPEASDIEPLYTTFSASLKASKLGKYYAELIPKLKLIAIGAKAPVFAQNDKDGKPVSVSSFKGKYLLIDFWASWCGPCRHENPNVVKAYNQYKDKNFTILGVSLDKPNDRQKWLDAIEKDGLVWTQVSDLQFWKNEAAVLYGVRAIPQNFLLDPDGTIIAKNLTGKTLTDKLAEIYSGKPAKTAARSEK